MQTTRQEFLGAIAVMFTPAMFTEQYGWQRIVRYSTQNDAHGNALRYAVLENGAWFRA